MPSGILPAASVCAGSVTLDNVTLGYRGKPVVTDVDGTIARGSLLALVGPNGAGKSTLLKALAGLHRPLAGSIRADDARNGVAYMAQHGAVDHAFPMSVLDFVAMGLWREIGLWTPLSQPQTASVHDALAQVGLQDSAHQRIGTLSGGQLRRALFARLSLQDSQLILLDEPLAGVDATTSQILMASIRMWHAQGRTIVAALHDLDQVRVEFPRTLLLAGRVIAWGDTPDVLTPAHCEKAFGGSDRSDG